MKRYKILALMTVATLLGTSSVQGFASTVGNLEDTATQTQNVQLLRTTSEPNPVSDFKYTENGDSVTIDGYIGTDTNVVIPETINGKIVNTIGTDAFSKTTITSIISTSVTTIGTRAFQQCFSLSNVDIPNVNTIGDIAFNSCTSITNLTFNNLTSISNNAFMGCTSLISIDIPLVNSIGYTAFFGCSNLKEIDIKNVTLISTGMFSGCSSLESINISSATTIKAAAFEGCSSLQGLNLPNVTTIGSDAFSGCSALNTISIASGLTNVGNNAFNGTPISSITIDYGSTPILNKTIDDYNNVVANLNGLDKTNVNEKYLKNDNYIKDLVNGLNYSITDDGGTIVSYSGDATELTIPERVNGVDVVGIGPSAFRNNSTLKKITINQNLEIGPEAFGNCRALESAIMPTLQTIGSNQFVGCTKLINVDAPNVITVGESAFSSCKALEKISFPNVVTINGNAFNMCLKLSNVSVDNVENLGVGAFSFCSNLKNINLPKIVTLPEYAFSGSTLLESIYCPNLQTIGDYALARCSSFKNIDFPNVTSIGESAFSISGVQTVSLPSAISIGKLAFYNCINLKSITLPEATDIGITAFGESGLESVTLPKVKTIALNAFYACKSLKSIILSKYVETAGINAFIDSPINSVTMDCGEESISYVTNNDFQSFLDKLTDLKQSDVTTKIVKNTEWSRNLPDLTPPEIIVAGDKEITIPQNSVYEDLGATASDDSRADIEVITDNKVNTSIIGDYTVTYTAYDPSGNKATATRIVHVEDKIAPVITLTDPNPKTMILGETYVEPGYSVTDNSGEVIEPVIKNNVDSSKVGSYTVTYTATDSAGNITTAIRYVNVIYNYSGVLSPLSDTNNTKNVFKAGSVIPVKFKLSNIYGKSISSANTTLSYAKVINNKVGDFKPANNAIFFLDDNNFRYDPFTKQYIFNMSTFGLSKGTYVLRISLDDGRTFENVQITLR